MAFAIANGFAFNSYVYGDKLASMRDSLIKESESAAAPGISGGYQGVIRNKKRMVELSGTIESYVSHEDLRDTVDDFRAALDVSTPGKLLVYNDRYLWAAPDGTTEQEYNNSRLYAWTQQFVCHDPFYYAVASSSKLFDSAVLGAFSTPRTDTATTAGNTFCTPVITTVVTDHTLGVVLIENLTTGESVTFDPNANGTYILHCGPNCTDTAATNAALRNRLTLSGVNVTTLITEGDLIYLAAGANSIRVSGDSASTINFAWHDRYL